MEGKGGQTVVGGKQTKEADGGVGETKKGT